MKTQDSRLKTLAVSLVSLALCLVSPVFAQSLSLVPKLPASLAPAPTFESGEVSLTWTKSPSSNVVSYAVSYGTNRTAMNNSAGVGSVTNATIKGLIPANTYYFTVTARDSFGVDSVPSNMVTNFVQPKLVMLPDRWKVWVTLPAGRTNIVQSSADATFATGARSVLTNTSGGSIWFYATNDAARNFYRVKP